MVPSLDILPRMISLASLSIISGPSKYTFAKLHCKLVFLVSFVSFAEFALVEGWHTSKNPNSYGESGGPTMSARTLLTSASRQATAIAEDLWLAYFQNIFITILQ